MKGIVKSELPTIVERLKGGAPLIGESKALGFSHNGPLRAALKELLGEKGYDDLMQAKRPVMAQRSEDGVPLVLIDDSDVPVIFATPTSEGWRSRTIGIHDEPAFIAPDGTWYTRAPSNARADLIVDLTEKGVGRVRLRKTEPPERSLGAPAEETVGKVIELAGQLKTATEAPTTPKVRKRSKVQKKAKQSTKRKRS